MNLLPVPPVPATPGAGSLRVYRPEDMTDEQRAAFRALQRDDLKVGRAWALKVQFRTFWEYRDAGAAETFFPAGSGGRPTAGSSPWRWSPS